MLFSTQNTRNDRGEQIHLQMVGVCLENVVGSGMGPKLRYTEVDDLKKVKLPHAEVSAALESLMKIPGVEEAFIWNTCNRFEVYFFHTSNRRELEARIEETFFGPICEERSKLNYLSDTDVVHHLVRTAVGFNSGLPGERDVAQQLHSAVRLASMAGASGPLTEALSDSVFEMAREIREETVWKRFSPSYCGAALEEALRDTCMGRLQSGRVAVVGSSNTSRGSAEILRRRFGISEENVTVYHRCHHKDGQMKSMRRACRGSSRVRVRDYDSDTVHQAIAKSRLVIIGIDRSQPVISGERLARHLKGDEQVTVIDFNTFGSCEGLEGLPGVRLVDAAMIEDKVRDYANRLVHNPEFLNALEVLEPMVRERVRGLRVVFEDQVEGKVSVESYALGVA
ncbi:MAG: hypothetical protein KC917_12155 [Candidatus Omnitrophica bacterium]|nr:hypothetical protein [Candidatus Omnitrophota bacterium]